MKVTDLLTRSEKMSREYCATVVRIGEVKDIPGADKIGVTLVNGFSVVVAKADTHEGDIMFYCANETMLNPDFLRVNNQYEIGERMRNDNFDEVQKLMVKAANAATVEESEAFKAEAKSMVGFFNKHGRVKMITLRKQPSYGYLIHIDSMAKFCPKINEVDLEAFVNDPDIDHDFDTVDGVEFIKVYVPPINTMEQKKGSRMGKHQRKIDKFDRMIPGQFMLHYDTDQLNRNIAKIDPQDTVTLTVKCHGTSVIFGNVKVKVPHEFNVGFSVGNWVVNKLYKLFVPASKRKYDIDYGNIYSSRTVIKNQYLTDGVQHNFYGVDIWGIFNDLVKDYIPQDTTLYGEIVGYLPTGAFIQKGYDYGCSTNCAKLMPYRMVTNLEDGHRKEWEVLEVYEWTKKLMEEHEELRDKIMPLEVLYHGTLMDFYQDIPIEQHWHENVLEAMKVDKRLGMEMNEPLCKLKVPREGIVLRISQDAVSEAFKLKTNAFMKKEGEAISKGEVDIEMQDKY